jgi:hypothetical protein
MTRILRFTDDDLSKKRFEYIFHGLFILGNQNTQKGLSVLRLEIELLDKIEFISKPCDCGKTVGGSKELDRELDFTTDVAKEIRLNDNEFDLLYDYISKVPWSIGSSSREALKTLEWIKNANDHPVS